MNDQADVKQPDFLADIQSFCAKYGFSPTTFGRKVMSDPTFVFHIMKGRECRQATVRRVRDFMERHSAKVDAST